MSDNTIVKTFDPNRVKPLDGQPRKRFRGIPELAASIEEIGQSSPGIVTLIDDDPFFDAQLIDGERRLRACRMLGRRFRAEVRDEALDAEQTFVAAFGANFGKQSHDVMEIAHALSRMQDAGKTHEQMGRIAGKSTCWVSQHLSLLKLHPEVQAMMIVDGDDDEQTPKITFSIGMLLAAVDQDRQRALAAKIAAKGLSMAAARRLILKDRVKSGETDAYLSESGRHRSIATVESIVSDVSDRVGVYLDMPASEFQRLLDRTDNTTKARVVKAIHDAADNMESLADAISRKLSKPLQNRALTMA